MGGGSASLALVLFHVLWLFRTVFRGIPCASALELSQQRRYLVGRKNNC